MRRVVGLVPDLMDRSKVEAAARAAGISLCLVADAAALARAARLQPDAEPGQKVDLVIIDLHRPGAIDTLPHLDHVRTVGFASHVDHQTAERARQAGCQEVLARSRFFARLPELLALPDA